MDLDGFPKVGFKSLIRFESSQIQSESGPLMKDLVLVYTRELSHIILQTYLPRALINHRFMPATCALNLHSR